MKKPISILVLVYITISAQAQYVRQGDSTSSRYAPAPSQMPSNSFLNHLSIGGSFGLQFGDVTFVALEPLLSYHFNESFMIGLGPIYQYENADAQAYGGFSYTSSIYGARIDALYFLPDELSRIFIMGECDVLNLPEANIFTYQLSRGNLTLPMMGIGYKEAVTEKFFFCAYILWNFNNSPYNPYTNPLINVGLDIGLGR
jgi:hypothetical protein